MKTPLLSIREAQRPHPSCELRGRARGVPTMAWTRLLLPLLTLCTGAAPRLSPKSDQSSAWSRTSAQHRSCRRGHEAAGMRPSSSPSLSFPLLQVLWPLLR